VLKAWWPAKVPSAGGVYQTSGSGILAIGAAKLGATLDGVEIDPLAIDNACENAELNDVGSAVKFSRTLAAAEGAYDLVLANILRPVLIEHAPALTRKIASGGTLILSGLIASDVPEIVATYSALLGGR